MWIVSRWCRDTTRPRVVSKPDERGVFAIRNEQLSCGPTAQPLIASGRKPLEKIPAKKRKPHRGDRRHLGQIEKVDRLFRSPPWGSQCSWVTRFSVPKGRHPRCSTHLADGLG